MNDSLTWTSWWSPSTWHLSLINLANAISVMTTLWYFLNIKVVRRSPVKVREMWIWHSSTKRKDGRQVQQSRLVEWVGLIYIQCQWCFWSISSRWPSEAAPPPPTTTTTTATATTTSSSSICSDFVNQRFKRIQSCEPYLLNHNPSYHQNWSTI